MDAYDADDEPDIKLVTLCKELQSVARGLRNGKKLNRDILTLCESRLDEVLRILIGMKES